MPSQSTPRYELHFDHMDETYSIHRVEVLGPFKTRDEARQYMLDTADERLKPTPWGADAAGLQEARRG